MGGTCNCLNFGFFGVKCQIGNYDFYISGSENGRPFYLGSIMSIEYKIYWDGTQWVFQQTDPSFPEIPFFSTVDTSNICELTGLDWQIGDTSTFPTNCTLIIVTLIDCPVPTTTTTTFPVTTTTTTFFPIPNTPLEPTNECDVITIFPMGVECNSLNPSFNDTFDGVASLIVTGGTPPYEVLWNEGSRGLTITNLGVGEYSAIVTDYYNDFTISTTCTLTAETHSVTTTTSTLNPLPVFDNICGILSKFTNKIYGSIFVDFIYDGYFNNKPSWLSNDSQYFLYWNTGSTQQWIISGVTNGIIYNQNPSEPPITGWDYLGPDKIFVNFYSGSCTTIEPLSIQISKNNSNCNNNGSIIITANGGVGPYEYSIDGGTTYQTNPIFNNLAGGTYLVFVKDSINNIQNQPVTLTQTITNTNYTLTLNKTLNTFNITISPALPIGTSINFDLKYDSVFTVAPSPVSATHNLNISLFVDSILTPQSLPIITNTTNFNPCNSGSFFITNRNLQWQNITMNSTTVVNGTIVDNITPTLPQPACYSGTKTSNIYLDNVSIIGCECCTVFIQQSSNVTL